MRAYGSLEKLLDDEEELSRFHVDQIVDDIDNDYGDPALMVAGVIIEIDCDADEADSEIALQEAASAEGINMEIV